MIKELSYKNKFELLALWNKEIIQAVKKEIKTECVKKDSLIAPKLCDRKLVDKLSFEEMTMICLNKITEGGDEELGEWVTSRWVFKHAEIYQFFAQELSAINPKFDEIEAIEPDKENKLLQMAIEQYGASNSYIFCVLNSVVFSEKAYAGLRAAAEVELKEKQNKEETLQRPVTIEELRQKYESEILKITDRYEKRLQGIAKKHQVDVEGFRKQISQLQKKLEEVRVGSR